MPCVAAGQEVITGTAIGPDNHNNNIIIVIIVIIINRTPSGRCFCINPSAMYVCAFYFFVLCYDRIIIRWSLYLHSVHTYCCCISTTLPIIITRDVDQVVVTRQGRRDEDGDESITSQYYYY